MVSKTLFGYGEKVECIQAELVFFYDFVFYFILFIYIILLFKIINLLINKIVIYYYY